MSLLQTGTQTVELWRYTDPIMGPRAIPNLNSPLSGKELIPSNAVFHANVEKGQVDVSINSKSFSVGSQIVYIVK